MQSAVSNVVYRDLDVSQALNALIDKKLQKLSRFSNQIQFSRIVLDSPHKHKHKGKLYRATIELDIKGNPVTVTQNDASIHVAVRDMFNTAERKLKELASKYRRNRHSDTQTSEDEDWHSNDS